MLFHVASFSEENTFSKKSRSLIKEEIEKEESKPISPIEALEFQKALSCRRTKYSLLDDKDTDPEGQNRMTLFLSGNKQNSCQLH